MKKVVSVVLAVIMLAAVLSGCTTLVKLEDGTWDRGAVINLCLSGEVYNLDPQLTMTDENMLKVTSLLFEGLTRIDANGKWYKALMKDYTVRADDRDGYSVLVYLNRTKWTDARTVQAIDFVYSWKRALDPNNACEAASLLYDIKNAREIKRGDAGISIDDLGVSAVDTYTIKITFRNSNVDLDRFFRNCAAPALVPLREDIITRYGDKWATKSTSICSDGPFVLRQFDTHGEMRLERSGYYYRDPDRDKYYDKYVIPYRLTTNYKLDPEAQATAYDNGEIFYLGDIALSRRADYKNSAHVTEMMTTHTYFFNTNNPILSKPEVRRALSLAIDRERVAETLTFAKPATGYIPYGVAENSAGSSFRKTGGDLISATANVEEAKSLLGKAGVGSGSFSIAVRDSSEADIAVAEYIAEAWGALGFSVSVEKIGPETLDVTENDTTTVYTVDTFQNRYKSGEFDVIAVDMNMEAPDAFSALSQFSAEFSGNGVDMNSGNYEIHGHVTGYSDKAYDELIEEIYAGEDPSARAGLLHDAEAKLLEDMPVCPIVFLQNAYLSSGILSGFKTDLYGTVDFKRVTMKNYMNYKTLDEED